MPSIKDDSTVEAIAREFTSTGRNKTETLKTIGYTEKYADSRGLKVVFGNVRVKEAIARLDAKTQAKVDYNFDIAVAKLCKRLDYIQKIAKGGNVQAVQAQLAILRELNDIVGLHTKQPIIVQTNIEHKTAQAEQELLKGRLARLERMGSLPDCVERS